MPIDREGATGSYKFCLSRKVTRFWNNLRPARRAAIVLPIDNDAVSFRTLPAIPADDQIVRKTDQRRFVASGYTVTIEVVDRPKQVTLLSIRG